jgi:hypothetical protein
MKRSMNGIPVQSSKYHPDYNDGVREAFLVKVGDEWFRIEHSSDAVFDSQEENQRPQPSGVEHHIEMVRCGPPELELPDEVRQFVEFHLKTGCCKAGLFVPDKDAPVPLSFQEGWQPERRGRR